jgi:hypothetical protein
MASSLASEVRVCLGPRGPCPWCTPCGPVAPACAATACSLSSSPRLIWVAAAGTPPAALPAPSTGADARTVPDFWRGVVPAGTWRGVKPSCACRGVAPSGSKRGVEPPGPRRLPGSCGCCESTRGDPAGDRAAAYTMRGYSAPALCNTAVCQEALVLELY